jgi:hypothetical protein
LQKLINIFVIGDTKEKAAKAEDIKQRALNFLLRLLEEAEKRLPENMAVFRQLSFFSPSRVLSTNPPRFSDMPYLDCVAEHSDLSDLEEQWRQVPQVLKFVAR